MKKILFILVFILSSCYCSIDLNDINVKSNNTRADEYYWYYDPQLFYNVDTCQVVGTLSNNINNDWQINRRCIIYNDTIYIVKRYIAKDHNIFDGVIYIKDKGNEPFRLITILK